MRRLFESPHACTSLQHGLPRLLCRLLPPSTFLDKPCLQMPMWCTLARLAWTLCWVGAC